MTGDGSKVQCYKEQYYIGTWNVRSMNQGKLEVVRQEMARVNIDILGISELKWTRASLVAQMAKTPPAMQETPVLFLSWEDPLEKR